jgi:death-on-curing family protein
MTTAPAWNHLISRDKILALHQSGIELYGGDLLPPRENCLEQSMGNAYTAEQYKSSDDSVEGFIFSAYLLFYLVDNHCFTDGNKRIGWLAAMQVLLGLGLTVNATNNEAFDFCMRIADSTKANCVTDAQEVLEWISDRIIEI